MVTFLVRNQRLSAAGAPSGLLLLTAGANDNPNPFLSFSLCELSMKFCSGRWKLFYYKNAIFEFSCTGLSSSQIDFLRGGGYIDCSQLNLNLHDLIFMPTVVLLILCLYFQASHWSNTTSKGWMDSRRGEKQTTKHTASHVPWNESPSKLPKPQINIQC